MGNNEIPKTRLRQSIQKDEFINNINSLNISMRKIRYFLQKSDFFNIPCRNHQLHFFVDFFKENYNETFTYNVLSVLFDMNPKTVRRNLNSGLQSLKPPGRHNAFDEQTENEIVQEIISRYQSYQSMTQIQILEFVISKFKKNVTKGWVNAFIGRHQDELQKCYSIPQEDSRLCIPRLFLDQHITNMKTYVSGKCSELVFNIDEVGLSEWEDRKIKKVIVPKSADRNNVYHSINRKVYHISMLVCISAGGDALTPLTIMKNKLPKKIIDSAIRLDEDMIFRQRDKPYMDESLFYEYITNVFIPYIENVRVIQNLNEETAVLMMDSASCHCSERIMKICGQNNVIVLVYPSHTSNIFQALDLSFFGILKRNIAKENQYNCEEILSKQIFEIIQSYEKTATSLNIRSSFLKAGIKYNVSEKPIRLMIDENIMRENEGFKEIWDKNISIDILSKRRKDQKFGVLNSEYLSDKILKNDK